MKFPIHKFSKSISNNIIEEINPETLNNNKIELNKKKDSISTITFSPEKESYSHRTKKKKDIKIGIEFDDFTTNKFYNNTANFQPLSEESEDEKIYLKSLPNKSTHENYNKNYNIFEKKNQSEKRKILYHNSTNDIEKYIEKYLETGTVTRKFDGIKVDIKDGKLMYEFEGGLNGIRQTTGNPLINQRLQMSKGDDDSINESGININK